MPFVVFSPSEINHGLKGILNKWHIFPSLPLEMFDHSWVKFFQGDEISFMEGIATNIPPPQIRLPYWEYFHWCSKTCSDNL